MWGNTIMPCGRGALLKVVSARVFKSLLVGALAVSIVLFILANLLRSDNQLAERYKACLFYNDPVIDSHPISPNVTARTKDVYGYTNYSALRPLVFHLSKLETNRNFFLTLGDHKCFIEGTKSIQSKTGCQCADGYFGKWCSFPRVLKHVKSLDMDLIKPRLKPRRIVFASPFNNEFEMLETRLDELGDVVDIFMFSESNYTGYGDPKDPILLNKLRAGYLAHMQHKIAHVYYSDSPKEGFKNGWKVNDFQRNVLRRGLEGQIVGIQQEDLFLLTDADELPNRQSVLFLKLHEGIPEPIAISLDKRTYGFFWRSPRPTIVSFACTFAYFRHVLDSSVIELRKRNLLNQVHSTNIQTYLKTGGLVKYWEMGDNARTMGWHCSWCKQPEGIRTKLVSAINADFPRWGDYPEKTKLDYIKSLIKTGMWFNGKLINQKLEPDISNFYAPKYLKDNWSQYHYLLVNPYSKA